MINSLPCEDEAKAVDLKRRSRGDEPFGIITSVKWILTFESCFYFNEAFFNSSVNLKMKNFDGDDFLKVWLNQQRFLR